MKRNVALFLIFFVLLLPLACARTRHAVPPDLTEAAEIVGMSQIRTWAGEPSQSFQRDIIESFKQESRRDFPENADGIIIYPALAVSGGGDQGAYGAGLLNGWSKAGTRPVFKVVTGVSTGALVAPMAFLGKEYDARLEKLYTTISTKDILHEKGPLSFLMSDSVASSKPLEHLIAKNFDMEDLAKIAKAHSEGRRLYIATTNLDAQKLVIWNMGKIASIGTKEALDLSRRVLLASASIPVALPPVYFDVDINGKRYDEMHVDGGTTTQVFFLFGLTEHLKKAMEKAGIDPLKRRLKLYIVLNSLVRPSWQEVNDRTLDIASRAVNTLIMAQFLGDLYRLFAFSEDQSVDYNLAYVPDDYIRRPKELFDRAEMRRLFDLGYEEAVKGYPWHKDPPGWESPFYSFNWRGVKQER